MKQNKVQTKFSQKKTKKTKSVLLQFKESSDEDKTPRQKFTFLKHHSFFFSVPGTRKCKHPVNKPGGRQILRVYRLYYSYCAAGGPCEWGHHSSLHVFPPINALLFRIITVIINSVNTLLLPTDWQPLKDQSSVFMQVLSLRHQLLVQYFQNSYISRVGRCQRV